MTRLGTSRAGGAGCYVMANFYLFEIANWNEGTANLTLEQEAAYLRIVNAIRLSDQPLTMNKFALCGMWRCNERKAKRLLDDLISAGKISIEGGKIVNSKAVRDALAVRESRPERLPTTRRPRADHAPNTHRLATDEANMPPNPLKTLCAPARPIEENIREEKSLPDTSYLPDSMPGCSAAASQPPPTSAEAGAAPPAPPPARDASACAPPPPPAPANPPERPRDAKPGEDQAKIDAAQVAMAVAVFNKLAAEVGWPAVKPPLSAVRASKLRARIKRAGGIAEWLAQMRRAAASDFLTGKSESGWKASFDFFSQESSFDRLIEGNYDNSTKQPAKHDRGPEGARGAGRSAGSRDQRDGGGPHRGLLAGFAQASQRLDPDPNVARNGGDDPALG